MTKELQNQILKVNDELYKLHQMLPLDERIFYIEAEELTLVSIAQMIWTDISLKEIQKEIEREINST